MFVKLPFLLIMFQVALPQSPGQPDQLFSPFAQNSLENIQQFKTKIFKLIEAQTQYFELIQQKKPSSVDYDYLRFEVLPPHEIALLNNQNLLSVPVPNLHSNRTQLMVTIDYNLKLSIWQFHSESEVKFLFDRQLKYLVQGFKCIKLKSFVFECGSNRRRPRYCLHVLTQLQQQNPNSNLRDFLKLSSFSFFLDGFQNVQMELQDFDERDQTITSDQIVDFDLFHHKSNVLYMALVQNNLYSNFKHKLSLYKWDGVKFDEYAWQTSDYVMNANRVKIARLNNLIHLICSYGPSNRLEDPFLDHLESFTQDFISVFRLKDKKLVFVSTVHNYTSAKDIQHLTGNNDFFFLRKEENIDVYWWDGHSLTYYDTLAESRPLTFTLHKLPFQPPLIVSSDGSNIYVYYKEYSKFFRDQIHLEARSGYLVETLQVFSFNRNYFVSIKFSEMENFRLPIRSYNQLVRIRTHSPTSDDEIHNLGTCLADLRNRIDGQIGHVKTLKRKSTDLLVITPTKPVIEVDVIVNQAFRAKKTAKALKLRVPMEQIAHGRRVLNRIQASQTRLRHLNDVLQQRVVTRLSNQTIISNVLFNYPLFVDSAKIDSVLTDFYLKDTSFSHYFNNCLTLNTDQVIHSEFRFGQGLQVKNLLSNQINGIDMQEAIVINGNEAAQFITGNHRFEAIELMNGTSAPVINGVKLSEVYQDSPESTQLLQGEKHFENLTTTEVNIDQLFNGIKFREFLSEVVWLDNPNIQEQELYGLSRWTFFHPIHAKKLLIENKINGDIDINYFVNFTAKASSDSPLVINGVTYFETNTFFKQNLHVAGLINGLNLYDDVVLLHSEQDFTKKSIASKGPHFDSLATFTNLTTNLINHRFRTEDFLLKSPEFATSPSSVYLKDKIFQNDLIVRGDVDVEESVHFNGVDLSELFRQLDTFVSFNTPLMVKEIVVGKQIFATRLNQYSSSEISQRLNNLWLRNISQVINVPFLYKNSFPIQAKNLYFTSYRNYLKFPEHFVPKANNIHPVFTAFKFFSYPIKARNVVLGPRGFVNGMKVSELYRRMVHQGQELTSTVQAIHGEKKFRSIIVRGNLYVQNGAINRRFLNRIVRTDAYDQDVNLELVFEHVRIEMQNFTSNDLTIRQNLNFVNYGEFWQQAARKPTSPMSTLVLANKHFPRGLFVDEILANGTIGSVDIRSLLANAITLDTDQEIVSTVYFRNATFHSITTFEALNGKTRAYFADVVLKSTPVVHIYGRKHFKQDMFVKVVDSNGIVNRVINVTHMASHTLHRYSLNQQIFTETVSFMNPLRIVNLKLSLDATWINGFPLASYAILSHQNIQLTNDIVFENEVQVGGLIVVGLISQCDLNNVAAYSIPIKADHTFDLPSIYNVPQLTVIGDIHVTSTINNQPNFLPHIMTVDDSRPLQEPIEFAEDIAVHELYINNLVNEKNLTLLLQDAVYSHFQQRIIGHKFFRKPLKIYGYVGQATNSPGRLHVGGLINKFNITDLFTTTVMSNIQTTKVITGKKFFTGKITFSNVNLGQLNGLQMPDDYVLTYTNERIQGKTHFLKKVHLHRDLNARLVNNVNVTQFVQNTININHVFGDEITSIINFVQPIVVHNLTVLESINDIPVDNLIHRGIQEANIGGRKTFRAPLHITGQLSVPLVNGLNLRKDIGDEMIDLRGSPEKLPNSSLTGTITFDDSVHFDNMNIHETINNIHVTQVTYDHIKELEDYLVQSNRSIRESIVNLNRTRRDMDYHFTEYLMSEIRYFKPGLLLDRGMESFYPLDGRPTDQFATSMITVEAISGNQCTTYRSKMYGIDLDTGMLTEQRLLPPFNHSKLMLVRSVTDPKQIALIASYSSTCVNPTAPTLAGNDQHYLIQFWRPEQFITIQYTMAPSKFDFLDQFLATATEIRRSKMFGSNGSQYVLIHYQSSVLGLSKLKIFKRTPDGQVWELPNKLANLSLEDIDLIQLDQPYSEPIILLAAAGQNDLLWLWNKNVEQFEPSVTVEGQSHMVRFIRSNRAIFVLLVASATGSDCNGGYYSKKKNVMFVYKVESPKRIAFYQRLSVPVSITEIESVSVGSITYVLLSARESTLYTYQMAGYNRLQLISKFSLGIPIKGFVPYWTDHNRLFLAIQSNQRSQLISAVMSGSGRSVRTNNITDHYRKFASN